MFTFKPLYFTLFSFSVFSTSILYAESLTLHRLTDEQLGENGAGIDEFVLYSTKRLKQFDD
nr:hypothetical protein [Acinetobacter bereziniae]